MAAQLAVPRYDDTDSANNRLKARFRPLFWSSIIVATTVHFGAFVYWPELTAEDFSVEVEELTVFELPPEIEVPPPPQAIARPATPIMATTEVDPTAAVASPARPRFQLAGA